MILFDKAALTEKLGRKITKQIDKLLTPESGEAEVRSALDKLMNADLEKLTLKFGNEPAEILIAAAVGFLRLKGGDNSSAGTVAVDNINEAISIDPTLDNDTVFRQEFIYDLVKAGADQGDPALQAVLCDLYTGDIVAPGSDARIGQDGLTEEQLRSAISELAARAETSEEVRQALGVSGISTKQLIDELDWKPYTDNSYANARKYAADGRSLREAGRTDEAAEAFFRSAMFGNVESAAAYAALMSELFSKRDKKAELKANKIYKKTVKKGGRLSQNGESNEKIAALFEKKELADNPEAMFIRANLICDSRGEEEGLPILEKAADNGSVSAELTAADYYSRYDTFDFFKMMYYLFLALVNPGSWYAYGKVQVPFNEISHEDNLKAYNKIGELLEKLCYERDMIDELEELSEHRELKLPELTEEQRKAVFMWFLCDEESDARRQVLARLYATGFGTAKDAEKAAEIRRELCMKYGPKGVFIDADASDNEGSDTANGNAANEKVMPEGVIETSEPDSDTEKPDTPEKPEEPEVAEAPEVPEAEAPEAAEETPEAPGAPEDAETTEAIEEFDEPFDGPDFTPYEAYYAYALHVITAEGDKRDVELGKRLLKLIPEGTRYYRKASRLLALSETRTSELMRLGAMFHKEGNDGAMLKIYDAAEKLGSPLAARVLGRYYAIPENGGNEDVALYHYALGASRGDVQSMYLAGAVHQKAGDFDKAFDYFGQCAAAGKDAEDEDDRAVSARAMKEISDMYYSGALTGEKNVPRYLYWLDRAENAGYKLSDAAVDRRRAAENYFKLAQWQDVFNQAMAGGDEGYREWAVKTCAERKIPAAQEEYGILLYKKQLTAQAGDRTGRTSAADNRFGAYAQLKTPALSSPRAQYYAACALYLGFGCDKNLKAAGEMLPPVNEFGDPEMLRHEIQGMDACRKAAEAGERRADEAAEQLKKADVEFTAVFEEYGRDNVRFELADILIRAYDVPDRYSEAELKKLWQRGYRYLLDGYRKDVRCTACIDAYSPGRICEIAESFEDDEALSWFELAAERGDPAGMFGAGNVWLSKGRNAESGKIIDRGFVEKAKELIKRAAVLENARAELAMYTERKLFDVGTDESRLYLKRSAIHGNETAAGICRELEIAF